MTRPFIPFPIFPPYVYWRPNQLRSFPTNLAVADRLTQIDPAAHPFINIWYVDRYVNWIAHNWGAENPHRQYHSCIMGLEKMLNWSFAHGLSLVDWRRNDFENYAELMSGSERFAARRSFWIFTSRILQPHVKTLPRSPLLILLSSNPRQSVF